MLIGVPRETKNHEYRVGLTPAGAAALAAEGHQVRVERDAGARIGFPDEDYRRAGADIVPGAEGVYASELVVKVKELQPSEFRHLRRGLALFCYLHLAAAREFAAALLKSSATAIAYETVTDASGDLPLLTPMSEVAGRLAVLAGARCLTMSEGGSGVLLPGLPGVLPGRVAIIGGGVVGSNAARVAIGLGADVTLLDRNPGKLRRLEEVFGARLKTAWSNPAALESAVRDADLAIGAVLVPGRHAPRLISRATVAAMRPGSALVDVSIDQGGCAETSRPTSHSEPTYVEEGVVHYCVTNMPAATARSSTQALTNATLPRVLAMANRGWRRALLEDPGLLEGLQVHAGGVTHPAVAEDLGEPCVPAAEALAG